MNVMTPQAVASRPQQTVMREREVQLITGLSRTTRWRLAKRGLFPAPRQISPGAIGWLSIEIDEWLANRSITAAMTSASTVDLPSPESTRSKEVSR
jgi:prophage regulatory protein